MDEQRHDEQLEPIYNSSVAIQDIALKTSRQQWTIETGGVEVGRLIRLEQPKNVNWLVFHIPTVYIMDWLSSSVFYSAPTLRTLILSLSSQ